MAITNRYLGPINPKMTHIKISFFILRIAVFRTLNALPGATSYRQQTKAF
jgi:hypothetical protein